MKRARDSQKSRVYRSEKELMHSGKSFDTIEDIRKYVTKLISQKWFKKHFINTFINVRSGGSRWAVADLYGIRIPDLKWSKREMVVLHEIAHCVTRAVSTHDKEAGHGILYCKNYLKLVQHQVGKDVSEHLKKNFKEYGVKYCAKKNLSESQRTALKERAKINLSPIAAKHCDNKRG